MGGSSKGFKYRLPCFSPEQKVVASSFRNLKCDREGTARLRGMDLPKKTKAGYPGRKFRIPACVLLQLGVELWLLVACARSGSSGGWSGSRGSGSGTEARQALEEGRDFEWAFV